VASGIVVAVALSLAVLAGFRSSARWPGWLLLGYTAALVGGMRYYLSVRFTPPRSVSAVLSPPPAWFVLETAGLSAVALIVVAITLLILAALVEVAVPGSTGRWLRVRRTRRASAARHPGPVHKRFPARLRLGAPGGPAGRWLRGAVHVRPGSLLWEPGRGVHAVPVELASATIVPEGAGRRAKSGRAITVDTPTGRIQLECGAETFALIQRIATELANSSQPQTNAGPVTPGFA
jgi:hypothetical protein